MAISGKSVNEVLSPSRSSMYSDDDLNLYCQPCDRDGSISVANGYCTNCFEHLCETCFKVHKKHKLSKHHILLDKSQMPQTLQSSINVDPGETKLTKLCSKHKREVIKFFCQDHKAVLCSVCFTLEHPPSSCLVNYIPGITEDIIDGKYYHDIIRTMDTISNKFYELKDSVSEVIIISNDSVKNALLDIQTFRKNISQRLDELEKQVEDAMNIIYQENSEKLKRIETHCNDAMQCLQRSSDKIKNLNTSKQADKLFIEINCVEELVKDCEKQLKELANFDVKEYTFKKNETISTMLKENSLGTVVHKTLHGARTVAVPCIGTRQLSFKGEICVDTSKDKYICWITGMTFLSTNVLIITDWNNKAVKMVETCSKSVTDQLILDDRPWGITKVNKSELAVTLLSKRTIQFISASSNQLRIMKHVIKVNGDCYGISCFQDKLVVSFHYPVMFQILDLNGTVLTTIRNDSIFGNSLYILTNSSSIYISDSLMKTVSRLDWQGKVIGSYSGLGLPHGMTWSDDKTVFVCDRERNIIEEISEDCSVGKVLLTNLKYPHAVCWCAETGVLLYSCHTGNGKHNNYLQIYKQSEA